MPDREAAARGLRALADFLESHPDLPVPWQTDAPASVSGADDAAERAEVDRIAGILGVPAAANERGTHYDAERDFGGGVIYRATAITRAEMESYTEHMKAFHERESEEQ